MTREREREREVKDLRAYFGEWWEKDETAANNHDRLVELGIAGIERYGSVKAALENGFFENKGIWVDWYFRFVEFHASEERRHEWDREGQLDDRKKELEIQLKEIEKEWDKWFETNVSTLRKDLLLEGWIEWRRKKIKLINEYLEFLKEWEEFALTASKGSWEDNEYRKRKLEFIEKKREYFKGFKKDCEEHIKEQEKELFELKKEERKARKGIEKWKELKKKGRDKNKGLEEERKRLNKELELVGACCIRHEDKAIEAKTTLLRNGYYLVCSICGQSTRFWIRFEFTDEDFKFIVDASDYVDAWYEGEEKLANFLLKKEGEARAKAGKWQNEGYSLDKDLKLLKGFDEQIIKQGLGDLYTLADKGFTSNRALWRQIWDFPLTKIFIVMGLIVAVLKAVFKKNQK